MNPYLFIVILYNTDILINISEYTLFYGILLYIHFLLDIFYFVGERL